MTDPATLPGGFEGLVKILAALRAPDGCPWDREQTHESLLRYLWEESAEVAEAVQAGDADHLAEELGGVLLQVVFHAQLASESGTFTIQDVVQSISEKMIRRHPHVFGSARADTSHEVKVQWDQIKQQERAAAGKTAAVSLLDKVPKSLPALARAQRLQDRAAKAGFAWPNVESALRKADEEWHEWKTEMDAGNLHAAREEWGDLLFALVAVGRHMGIEAELSLLAGNAKFEERFRRLEAGAGGSDGLKALEPAELLRRWDALKPC